ncbi:hypothetical protein MBVG596_1049 [Mycoplasmopsis bovigenitalium]|uniref:hypothetical protein n=1 Tax=Mycoplasmopsis bovigenitalium TaxID=2112 RepID=UPI00090AD0C4|nr:hypothetical protein [Mycoplasmopsis bovigenitalium]BAW18539.1 hypothetical protein MBVG596_1049 [Mycoplasmopsis bovigenitalium]
MSLGDALNKDFNDWLATYLATWRKENPTGRVLFLENLPFRDETAESKFVGGKSVSINYVIEQIYKTNQFPKNQVRDLSFQFIYSANMHMQENDQYCLISPIKYWKLNHINFEFVQGFLSNRKHYNATDGGLPIIRWKKTNNHSDVIHLENATIIKVFKRVNAFDISQNKEDYYAKLSIGNTLEHIGNILTNTDKGLSNRIFYVNNENIKKISVLHCASSWKSKSYLYDILTVMKSADKQELAWADETFLNDCLLWTLLSDTVKCYSDETVKNQICLSGKAAQMLNSELFKDVHNDLINYWNEIIQRAKKMTDYQPHYLYGLNQINKDLNKKVVKYIDAFGKLQYGYEDDGLLNSSIQILKNKLKEFYSNRI